MSARDELLAGLRENLEVEVAESVVEYLEQLSQTGGILIMNGGIRKVLQADNYGFGAWEIEAECLDLDGDKRSYYG